MSIQYAQIHPENISWARERAQLNTTVLAKKLKITEKKLISWESGDGKVTFKQAKALADVLLIPFGYLFLEKVQNKTLSIPDLRTLANQGVHKPSVELIKIVQLIQEQQSWYKDYLLRQGFDVPLNIRIFNANSSIIEIVADMRRELSVDVEH
ncbi:MAG: helix-turn-helix transcriptional regulator, partial [Methylococcales symbiont of Hymedesmia sp. n. MRB-2018]